MSRRSRRTAAPGTMQERGETKIERHRKKPKGWRGDAARHSEASKRAEDMRRRNAAEKARTLKPTKKQITRAAKNEFRRKRGMPEEKT